MKSSNLLPVRILLPLVWLMFVVKSLAYTAVTPLWEGFDELFHFAYVQSLASTHSLPVWGETFVDAEITESTACVPLPELMPPLTPDAGKLSHVDYWQMDQGRRDELGERLRRLRASAARSEPSSVPLYQIQHPPLYYALCAPLYWAMDGWSITDKVFALRIFSVLLASLGIAAALLTAREIDSPLGPIFAALTVMWPCLYVDVARVGNDSLGVALFSFMFLGMFRYRARPSAGRAAALGAALGLGLLTKAYFLTAVPAVSLFTVIPAIRDKGARRKAARDLLLILACAGAVGGWWYARNFHLYGTFSGLQESVSFPAVGLSERLVAAIEMPWTLALKHLFVTFCWVSGWSFVYLPKSLYLIFAAFFAAVAAGLARAALSVDGQERMFAKHGNAASAAACLILFFALGVAYHKVNAFATMGVIGGAGGWYFYALVVPLTFLAALGVAGTGPRLARPIFVATFTAVASIEVVGLALVLAPYYTGFAIPGGGGWGVAYGLPGALVFSGEMMARLTANKPAFVTPGSLVLLAVTYCLVQAAVLWSAAAASVSPTSKTAEHSSAA